MIILGIDPGSTRAGYGLVSFSGTTPSFIDCGIIRTTTKNKNDLLVDIYTSLSHIIKKHTPDVVGIESLYIVKNLTTATEVAQSRGVCVLVVSQNKIPLYEFTPREVKSLLTGYGTSDKKAVTQAVQQIFKNTIPTHYLDDSFDALAIALVAGYTHINTLRIKK